MSTEPAAQKRFARIALVVLALLGIVWLARLDYDAKISTNVIDLIPKDEQSPEVSLVRSLVGEKQAKVVLLALQAGGAPASPEAANAFTQVLKDSGLFAEVVLVGDPASRDALGKFVFEKRFQLLLPEWLAEKQRVFKKASPSSADGFSAWLAEQSVADLDAFVARPESVAFQDIIPADPLLLVTTLAERSQALGLAGASAKASLVWAVLKPSPFADEGQAPVFTALQRALETAQKLQPTLAMQWTGVNRFAAESKERIRAELSWLNTVSLIAVLGVACVFVRRIWKVIHLVPVILLSILGAWVFATMAFERLHILVFVVGSLLTGVAIDYGFYLYMQPALRPDEPYRSKLGRLIKPLLASCLTTVIGFSFLLLSELPLIRQLGVFVSAGLLSALTAAILYFAQIDHPFLETRTLPRPDAQRWRGLTRMAAAVVVVTAIWGLLRLTWRDDVRELEVPAPDLRANDLAVRSLFGDTESRAVYITRGATAVEARENLDQFLNWHDHSHASSPAASLAWLIPSPQSYAAAPALLAQLGDFEAQLKRALEARGYTPESFERFFGDFREFRASAEHPPAYDSVVSSVAQQLEGPLGMLAHFSPNGSWFISIADHAASTPVPPRLNTVPISQLESLNTLFSRYRGSALRLSAMGLSLVGLSVFVLYGIRRGIRIFMIPSGSCVVAFGLLGLLGQPLNLFHLLGAFLGVCLSHNYAIFSAENAGRNEPPPPSIRLSALTTAASFGVLAISKIPVVAALGTSVSLIVLIALLVVELEPLGASEP
jgi:predicted exporter